MPGDPTDKGLLIPAVYAPPHIYIEPKYLVDYTEIQTKVFFRTDMSWKVIVN